MLFLLWSSSSVAGRRNDKAMQFSGVVLPKTFLDETYNETRESVRDPKLLFSTGFVQSQIGDIRQRLAGVESKSAQFPPAGVSGGYETFNDAKTNLTQIFSNITNIYEKIQKNRMTMQTKCSRQRCDMILGKVKKVKAEVEFLQKINITQLEEMLTSLKNSTTVTQISTMQTQLTSLSENATAQQVEINSLKTEVSSLQSQVSTLQTKVTSLENTTTINTQDIDKIGN